VRAGRVPRDIENDVASTVRGRPSVRVSCVRGVRIGVLGAGRSHVPHQSITIGGIAHLHERDINERGDHLFQNVSHVLSDGHAQRCGVQFRTVVEPAFIEAVRDGRGTPFVARLNSVNAIIACGPASLLLGWRRGRPRRPQPVRKKVPARSRSMSTSAVGRCRRCLTGACGVPATPIQEIDDRVWSDGGVFAQGWPRRDDSGIALHYHPFSR